MSEENVELVRFGYDAWNRGDIDGMLAILDPDVEYVTSGLFPDLPPIYRGHEGWRQFSRDFTESWESLKIEINELRTTDDRVVALLTFDARGRDGMEVFRQFANIWTIQNRLGVRLEAYAEWSVALQAAGLSE